VIPAFPFMQLHSLTMFLKEHSAHYILGIAPEIDEYFSFIL